MHRDRPVTYCQTEVWTSANKPQAKAHTLGLFLVHLLPSCFENYCPTAENLGWWLARHSGFDILPVVSVHPISMAEITNPERIETQVYTFQTFLPGTATPVALVYIPFSSTGLPTKESKCGRSTHWGPAMEPVWLSHDMYMSVSPAGAISNCASAGLEPAARSEIGATAIRFGTSVSVVCLLVRHFYLDPPKPYDCEQGLLHPFGITAHSCYRRSPILPNPSKS